MSQFNSFQSNSITVNSGLGAGYVGPHGINPGQTTCGQVFNAVAGQVPWANCTVLRNGQPATPDTILYVGDVLTISQRNAKGA